MSDDRLEAGFLAAACVAAAVAVALGVALPVAGSGAASADAANVAATGSDATGGAPAASGVDIPTDFAATGVTAPERDGTATVDGESFASAQAAVDAAEPGGTVVLDGRFDERVNASVDGLRLVAGEDGAVIDGGGEGRVLTISGENVTVSGVWVRGSGSDLGAEDAGVFVDGAGARIETVRITDTAYGIWVDGVDDAAIADVRIDGREDVYPRTDRGNGIHLFETSGTVVRDSEIANTRDGIYFSWATDVLAENNTIRNARYGVHYMYSDDNRLVDNVAADNGVGYALMVSEGLTVRNNTALRNGGTSGHGILAKDIEESTIAGNHLVANRNGLYLYNAQGNRLVDNLIYRNGIGVHSAAESNNAAVAGNSFVRNGRAAKTARNSLVAWNGSDRGNYWSGARVADRDGDGVSEIRHRPIGIVENLVAEHPQAAAFANSPAFEAVRLAESSFPVVETPGVVDRRPLVEPNHDWRAYEAAATRPGAANRTADTEDTP
ncbi:nitrous oxide reductase family maturation protein NosD [Halorubrum sp. GN11_10-6_MGM]|uniref:nitrous oxide reductase family maturation protein NosD n=1 Tax=Halorubrum sp. GN11_10-6_MGM TaxID=2518112 RepID=UPI0010F6A160|nr:nitrous oxide reductase family maturation protein NosD [Halorubrum sp. GN11_10-6_MGM]TKX75225.1 nitrous oxide reductase family maturation protein NosD [Halorubrum sp. GN11_10-6_MGM]